MIDQSGIKLSWPVAVVIVAIVFFGFGILASPIIFKNGATAAATAGGSTTSGDGKVKFDVPSYVPSLGSDSAKTYIVEFGDYQCPFCKRFFDQTEGQIMQNHVNNGKAKFYFLDFQFLGPDSLTLGEGAWCANEQGKYYEYHNYIYVNQGDENSGWATPDKVKTMVKSIAGLDAAKFNSCLDSKKYESRVTELTQLGQSIGVTGTPSTFIGNPADGYVMVSGAQPYPAFQQVLGA